MIEFKKTKKESKILNPLKNFQEDTNFFEYRTDPLTGRNTTVIRGMMNYVEKFLGSDSEIVQSLVSETKRTCPFCPENLWEKTPMFPKDFICEGRISSGNTTIIPNLLGHAECSVLAVISRNHYLNLNEFSSVLLKDAFIGGTKFLKILKEKNEKLKFPVFVFNYLPPAGSSIFHPHMQILVRDRPFFLVDLMLRKSREYFDKYGSSFWQDLINIEHGEKRHLFSDGTVEWMVPFAPLRGINEVQAVVKGKSNFDEISESEWIELSEGFSKILSFYHKQGYKSFNAIIVSGPLNEHNDYFDVNLIVISRPGIQKYSFTDSWAVPYMLWDGEAVEEPESLAKKIRNYLNIQ